MKLLLALALRNLFRHTRRTLLTVSALVLGIGIMIVGRAWTAAMEKAVVVPAKRATLGQIQVFAKNAAADEGGAVSFITPQNNYRLIQDPRGLITRILAAEPRLQAGLSRLMIGALLSAGDTTMEGILIGIDPEARPQVYPAIELREGRHFVPGEKATLVNRGLAKRLGVKVGDTVVALANAADGRLTAVRLPVVGVWVVKGLEAYEWGACYTSLSAVQELLDVDDAAGVLVLRQRDDDAPSAPIAASVNALFAREGIDAEAYTWEEMGGPFIGTLTLTRFVASVMDLIMMVIIAAGILNTALMAVFERTREIGTLRAVGARRSRIVALFLLEALLLGLAGALGGAALGAGAVSYLHTHGLPAFSEAQRYSYGGDYLFPVLNGADLLSVPGLMVLVCLGAGLGPAVMAARLRPAQALRYV
jgi:putative ABC transport system permease protein